MDPVGFFSITRGQKRIGATTTVFGHDVITDARTVVDLVWAEYAAYLVIRQLF